MEDLAFIEQEEEKCLKLLKQKISDEEGDENFKTSASRLDDDYLMRFVRGKKRDVEKAFTTLKNNIYAREVSYKDFYARLKPSTAKNALADTTLSMPLKRKSEKGSIIGVFNMGNWDPAKADAEEVLFAWLLQTELLMNDIDVQRHGVILITGNKGFGLKQLKNAKLSCYYMFFNLLKCYPVRIKAMHYVDSPLLFEILFKLTKSLVPAKMRTRMHSHHSTDLSILHQHISPKILPDYLGGELSHEEAIDFEINRKLLAHENLLLEPSSISQFK